MAVNTQKTDPRAAFGRHQDPQAKTVPTDAEIPEAERVQTAREILKTQFSREQLKKKIEQGADERETKPL